MTDADKVKLVVKEVLEQVAQQGTQQSSAQTAEAIQQALQKVQGSTQEKSSIVDSITQNKQEEILGAEALRSGVISNTRLWNFDEKLIAAKELEFDLALKALQLKDKEVEIARKQHDFAHKQKMDAQNLSIKQYLDQIAVRGAQNTGTTDHYVNVEYAKFNSATSEPIAPDTGADDKDAAK